MEVLYRNGVKINCTPEEFNRLHMGEVELPIQVELLSKARKPRQFRKRRKRRRNSKNTLRYLQRVFSPVFGTRRGAGLAEWSKTDDQFVLDNYPIRAPNRGKRLSAKELEAVGRMCHRLQRTPRAVQQRAWYLRRTRRAGKA